MPVKTIPYEYKVQIDTIVDDSIVDLLERFPDRKPTDFDLRMRTFVPTLDIFLGNKDQESTGEVFETVGHGSPQAEARDSFAEGEKVNYKNELRLQHELRQKEFNLFMHDKIRALALEVSDVTAAEIDRDYQLRNRLMSEQFLKWISDPEVDNVSQLVKELRPRYRAIFSRFKADQLVSHMRSILLRTFERRFRAAKIREHVDATYRTYLHCFDRFATIKAELYSVVTWYQENSKSWCKTQLFPECALLEDMPRLFRKLEGNESVLVTEIVPSNLTAYAGEIGGKTIKVCSYSDLNVQFYITEGLEIDRRLMEPKRLKELRDSFLRTIIARRYVFGDAIDHILKYTTSQTAMKDDIERLSGDPAFRALMYKLFYSSSKIFLSRIYEYAICKTQPGR